jgi:hypothetical protein
MPFRNLQTLGAGTNLPIEKYKVFFILTYMMPLRGISKNLEE